LLYLLSTSVFGNWFGADTLAVSFQWDLDEVPSWPVASFCVD
jgi:hypothetical protein